LKFRERQTAYGLEQRSHLVPRRRDDLTRTREAERSEAVTSDVQCNSVREIGVEGGHCVDANVVVKEGAKLRGAFGKRGGVQFHVYGAAAGEDHDPIVRVVGANEPREHLLGVVREARICRWLTATRRVARNRNAQTETLEHAERRNRDMRIELISEARNEERDARHAIRS
jgi:hypothetical protein